MENSKPNFGVDILRHVAAKIWRRMVPLNPADPEAVHEYSTGFELLRALDRDRADEGARVALVDWIHRNAKQRRPVVVVPREKIQA